MSSTAYSNLSELTVDNQGLREISDLLFFDILKAGDLSRLVTMSYDLLSGKVIGGIGEFDPVGTKQSRCKIAFNTTKLNTSEKIWELANLTIAEILCSDDFEKTIARFCMNKGINRADLTNTKLMTEIVIPRLRTAIEKAVYRISFFGDTTAVNVQDGGNITDGMDINLMTVTDGLFKRIFDIMATSPDQLVKIAANTAETKTKQRDDLRISGVATSIFDELIYDASSILKEHADAPILCTSSLAEALAIDIKANNKGSELQWKSIFDGSLVSATTYLDRTIIKVPIWDSMIQTFEDKGDTFNNPHRAIFCPKSCLNVGFGSTEEFKTFKIRFSEDELVNKITVQDEIGTLTWQDNLIRAAY